MKLSQIAFIFLFLLNVESVQGETLNKSANPIFVLTTFSILEDLIKQIGGNDVEVKTLIPPGQDPHDFEPKPQTLKILRKIDLFLANGLSFEEWLVKWLENSKVKKEVFYVSEGVKEEKTEKNLTDPHAWQDPLNVIIYCENIKNILCKEAPDRCSNFKSRFEDYRSKLMSLHHKIELALSSIPKKQRQIAVTHNFLRYFEKRYDLKVFSIFKTDSSNHLTAQDMSRAIDIITQNKIKIIFSEFSSETNPLALEVARETKNLIQGNLFSDSLSQSDGPGSHYISMMEFNLNKMMSALKLN